ncbi:MAG: VWA domain-containing protein [Deltaproteobacteria bacterium]|nr:VWA domain-containing protein [Deltaproteobacteria bacterium]MBW2071944.1 VWA domain-containing protein [Deltaproteobacteria bacterium]
MKKLLTLLLTPCIALVLSGCPDTTSHSVGVYMLLDSSGTYKQELNKAQAIVSYLLGTLQPGDSFAVARIDSGSFSEKDILAKMTFDRRPSVANQQKRLFKEKVEKFIGSTRSSAYTDITGGVLQAVEYLDETGAGRKYILIFSDLKEELVKGQVRDFPIQLDGCNVVALNVTKLRSDNIDPREYFARVEAWRKRVEKGGGHWRLVNDLERLESILGT